MVLIMWNGSWGKNVQSQDTKLRGNGFETSMASHFCRKSAAMIPNCYAYSWVRKEKYLAFMGHNY
jgi:hypothetical protein